MHTNTRTQASFVRLFEDMKTGTQLMLNDFDCPLMTLTNTIVGIDPTDIASEVSIMHECTDTCKFIASGRRIVERELIQTNTLSYVHDWTNKWYCLNIYCMI